MKAFFNFFKEIYYDAKNIIKKDPAISNPLEVILYPGIHAIFWHRIAHGLYICNFRFIPRLISQITKLFTRYRNSSRCSNRKKTIYRSWNRNCNWTNSHNR